MRLGNREIRVVGDRVLVRPEKGDERTNAGLYLPQSVVEKEKVAAGRIVAAGPGTPLPSLGEGDSDFWKAEREDVKYLPMQAEVGDIALFLRKAAVELQIDNETYWVVPQAGILVLIKDGAPVPEWTEPELPEV